jgi:hypothetical protein
LQESTSILFNREKTVQKAKLGQDGILTTSSLGDTISETVEEITV